MEALSMILTVKLVADDMRHSVGGDHEVRRTADEALQFQRREHRLWTALRRGIKALTRRRPPKAESVVDRPCAVAQSSSD